MATVGYIEIIEKADAAAEFDLNDIATPSPPAEPVVTKVSNIVIRTEEPRPSSPLTLEIYSSEAHGPHSKHSEQPCHACMINASSKKRTRCQAAAAFAASVRARQEHDIPARTAARIRPPGDAARADSITPQPLAKPFPTDAAGWRAVPAQSPAQAVSTYTSVDGLTRCSRCRGVVPTNGKACPSCHAELIARTDRPVAATPGPAPPPIPRIILTTPAGHQIPLAYMPEGRPASGVRRRVDVFAGGALLRVPPRSLNRRERAKAGFCDMCAAYRCARHWRHSRTFRELVNKSAAERERKMTEEDGGQQTPAARAKGAVIGSYSTDDWLRMALRVPRAGSTARGIRINGMWIYEDVAPAA